MNLSVAMLSVHTSPLDSPGRTKNAGGMNVYMRELATELGHHQTNVDIFTRWTNENTPRIVQLSQNVRVIHIKAGALSPLHKSDLYQHLPEFIHNIEAFRHYEAREYDVLHSHYWLSGVAASHLARLWDIPHVTMFHTLARLKQLANPYEQESFLRLEMEQQLIKHADRIITATADERAQLIRYCGATTNQVQVIPCGVDLKLFVTHDKQEARKKLGLSLHQPVLLFVGRLDPFKGPDLYLQAAAMMEEKAQVVIVGGKLDDDREVEDLQKLDDDREVEDLQKLARDLGISHRVHFWGARPQEELPMIYSAADATVIPSYHESFGLVAVESLACGTPVVATRAGGLTTIVKNAKTGYLVPRCPGFFAERLDTLLRDRDLLEQMHLAARPSVQHFSWKSVADQVSNVYQEMVCESAQLVAQ